MNDILTMTQIRHAIEDKLTKLEADSQRLWEANEDLNPTLEANIEKLKKCLKVLGLK